MRPAAVSKLKGKIGGEGWRPLRPRGPPRALRSAPLGGGLHAGSPRKAAGRREAGNKGAPRWEGRGAAKGPARAGRPAENRGWLLGQVVRPGRGTELHAGFSLPAKAVESGASGERPGEGAPPPRTECLSPCVGPHRRQGRLLAEQTRKRVFSESHTRTLSRSCLPVCSFSVSAENYQITSLNSTGQRPVGRTGDVNVPGGIWCPTYTHSHTHFTSYNYTSCFSGMEQSKHGPLIFRIIRDVII